MSPSHSLRFASLQVARDPRAIDGPHSYLYGSRPPRRSNANDRSAIARSIAAAMVSEPAPIEENDGSKPPI
jgi:hypothetical protein